MSSVMSIVVISSFLMIGSVGYASFRFFDALSLERADSVTCALLAVICALLVVIAVQLIEFGWRVQ